jgi:hypothetical protein
MRDQSLINRESEFMTPLNRLRFQRSSGYFSAYGIKSGGRLWAPFRLQFYCNGHSWLAHKLTAQGIGYTMADNAFVRIDD